MRRFRLLRKEDVSGISGTGVVAEGVEFGNGRVALGWSGSYATVEVAPDIATIEAIHGHKGKTSVVWLDKESEDQ